MMKIVEDSILDYLVTVSPAHCRQPTADCSCLLSFVARPDDSLDISANMKVALQLNTERIARAYEVVEDHIDYVLVENLYFAERVYIEFETLQLDASFIRNVLKPNNGEVREVGKRADGREFGDFEVDGDFASGEFVGESVEREELHLFTRGRTNIKALLIDWRQL